MGRISGGAITRWSDAGSAPVDGLAEAAALVEAARATGRCGSSGNRGAFAPERVGPTGAGPGATEGLAPWLVADRWTPGRRLDTAIGIGRVLVGRLTTGADPAETGLAEAGTSVSGSPRPRLVGVDAIDDGAGGSGWAADACLPTVDTVGTADDALAGARRIPREGAGREVLAALDAAAAAAAAR